MTLFRAKAANQGGTGEIDHVESAWNVGQCVRMTSSHNVGV
jgi:hypothetical protein